MKCRQCPNEVIPDRSHCAGCLVKLRDRKRRFYAAQRAAGGCAFCTSPAEPGRSMCERHRTYYARRAKTPKVVALVAASRQRSAERKAAGGEATV